MRRNEDRGASLVEFALILPVLVLFLFGIIQFGVALDARQSANSAAREGARTAAIPTSDRARIEAAVVDAYDAVGSSTVDTVTLELDGALYVPNDAPCDGSPGSTVTVIVDIDHDIVIPLMGTIAQGIEAEGSFRCERGAP